MVQPDLPVGLSIAAIWRKAPVCGAELLGDEFPAAGSSGSASGGFSPRTSASVLGAGRFG